MKEYTITKNGKPVDPSLYTICNRTQTFSTAECGLVLNFEGYHNWTFKTGSVCAFYTGNWCTFNAGRGCTFYTGCYCTFSASGYCTFNTKSFCTFSVWASRCHFNVEKHCVINTYAPCTVKGYSNNVIVRGGLNEVHQLPDGKKVTFEDCIPGYKVIEVDETHTISIDGEDISISKESFEALKASLNKGQRKVV